MYLQDLYEENYKTLMKEINEELNRWRDSPRSWIGTLSIVRVLLLPKLIYRFNAIPNQIPTSYFMNTDILILKYIWRGKILRIASVIVKYEVEAMT